MRRHCTTWRSFSRICTRPKNSKAASCRRAYCGLTTVAVAARRLQPFGQLLGFPQARLRPFKPRIALLGGVGIAEFGFLRSAASADWVRASSGVSEAIRHFQLASPLRRGSAGTGWRVGTWPGVRVGTRGPEWRFRLAVTVGCGSRQRAWRRPGRSGRFVEVGILPPRFGTHRQHRSRRASPARFRSRSP